MTNEQSRPEIRTNGEGEEKDTDAGTTSEAPRPTSRITEKEMAGEIITRFWRGVEKREPDECWNWKYATTAGYGSFTTMNHRTRRAHRYSFAITFGNPSDGLQVLHRCDNKLCVNPSHLWAGTTQDNTRDRDMKNRTARGDRSGAKTKPERILRGEQVPSAKLTEREVVEIRQLRNAGLTLRAIGERFKTDLSNVSLIAKRKHWKHVA